MPEETTQQKLVRLAAWRDEYAETLRTRLAELREERRQAVEMYDAEIAQHEGELRAMGTPLQEAIGSHRRNGDAAERVVQLLNEQPGTWLTSREINRTLGMSGVLAIVLVDHLADGRVEKRGDGAGTCYRVPAVAVSGEAAAA